MNTSMAVMRTCIAAVAVLALAMLTAGPVLAHSEGLTPYRYVVAPAGVESEGPAEAGVSTQPIGPPGFAGTTDNQMQLTLPEGVLPSRPGQQGVRVQLDQLDPADLPPLPGGLEPEGNGYRVGLTYAPSGAPVGGLVGPAMLGLSAPAPPTSTRWSPQWAVPGPTSGPTCGPSPMSSPGSPAGPSIEAHWGDLGQLPPS